MTEISCHGISLDCCNLAGFWKGNQDCKTHRGCACSTVLHGSHILKCIGLIHPQSGWLQRIRQKFGTCFVQGHCIACMIDKLSINVVNDALSWNAPLTTHARKKLVQLLWKGANICPRAHINSLQLSTWTMICTIFDYVLSIGSCFTTEVLVLNIYPLANFINLAQPFIYVQSQPMSTVHNQPMPPQLPHYPYHGTHRRCLIQGARPLLFGCGLLKWGGGI